MGRQAAALRVQDFEAKLPWPPAPANDPVVLSPEPFDGALRASSSPQVIPAGKSRRTGLIAGLAFACLIAATAATLIVGRIGLPANPVAASVAGVAETDRPGTEQLSISSTAAVDLSEGLSALRSQMQAAVQKAEPVSTHMLRPGSTVEAGMVEQPAAASTAEVPAASPTMGAVSSPIGPSTTEVGATLERTRGLIAIGDIASARRLAEYAAVGGNGDALFILAETFDPAQLSRWRVRGIHADVEKARTLYRRALERGVADAGERLTHLP